MALTYTQPGVTVQSQGAATVVTGGLSPKTVMLVGTAPFGPDYPVLCNAAQAQQLFGDPSQASTLGYTLPLGLKIANAQRQPTRNAAVQYLMCRVGVTRASVAIKDGAAATDMTIYGVGPYAGSRGNNLRVGITTSYIVVTNVVVGGPSTNAVQSVYIIGTASAGTFTLTYGNQTTGSIAYNAAAATVQTALTGLSNIGVGNVTVTGSGTAASPWVLTFGGTLANTNVPLVSAVGTGIVSSGTALVNSITITDTLANVTKQTYTAVTTNFSSVQNIINAINGANPPNNPNSIVFAVAGASTLLPAALSGSTGQLSGGADGLGALYSDTTIPNVLAQTLNIPVDYVVALFDANTIAPTVMSHLNSARAQNSFRKAVLGPSAGTTYSTLSGSSYNDANSSTVVFIGHDSAIGPNPLTGVNTVYDGFYLAAAYAGLKAVGPTAETCTGFPISGFNQICTPSDLAATQVGLTQSQLNTLAGLGFLVFENYAGSSAITVRDALTTAPYSINNGINPFSQFNVQDIDDAVSAALVNAVLPFKGRPGGPLNTQITQLKAACSSALAQLGDTINGVNSITVTVDPTTLIPTIVVSYITRYPILQIIIQTSYTFS